MEKEEVKNKLEELGIEYDGRWTLKRLMRLLPNSKEKEEVTDNSNIEKVSHVENLGPVQIEDRYHQKMEYLFDIREKDGRAEVWKKDGTYIRSYSRAEHGHKYLELAEQFVRTRTWRLKGYFDKNY